MTTKTIQPSDFKKTLSKIIKEEISLMREQSHPVFDRLGAKKSDFIDWVLRQYFDKSNNANSNWYDPSVNKSNLLSYLSKSSSNFPLSPTQIVDFYRNMKSLQKKMSSPEVSSELDAYDLNQDDEETDKTPVVTNNTGAVTLKDVGDAVGGVTAAMVNKIEADGYGKFQDLFGGKSLNDFSPEDEANLEKRLADAEVTAANTYADMLAAADGSVGKFLLSLQKAHYMTENEGSQITDNEIETLMTLAKMPRDRVIEILRKDLHSPNGNVVKSFQSVYSKTIFPPKKRGRPAKQ